MSRDILMLVVAVIGILAVFGSMIFAITERDKRVKAERYAGEAERKMNQVIREREEEILYDLQMRDQDNIPDDEEWIDRGGYMPAYRNIPDEWRNRE